MKSLQEELIELEEIKERRDILEHQDALLALGTILKKPEGVKLFKYLFKSFDVGQMPEIGLEGVNLHDRLGFLRAGNSIFKLISEADPEISASILANIERERYDDLIRQYKIENGFNRTQE